MSGIEAIFPIIAVLGALILALRGLGSHRLSLEKKIWMAAAWAAIIGGLVFLLSSLGV